MSEIIRKQDVIEMLKDTIAQPSTMLDNLLLRLHGLPSAPTDLTEYSDKLWKAAYERGKADGQKTVGQKELQTADVAEVVRCKDCAFYRGIIEDCCHVYTERVYCPTNFVQADDDYCSWGVRKVEE